MMSSLMDLLRMARSKSAVAPRLGRGGGGVEVWKSKEGERRGRREDWREGGFGEKGKERKERMKDGGMEREEEGVIQRLL